MLRNLKFDWRSPESTLADSLQLIEFFITGIIRWIADAQHWRPHIDTASTISSAERLRHP